MGAKTLLLRITRRLVVMKIEPGLADRHYFRMVGKAHKIVDRHVQFLIRIVRMGAD